ncbi:MAG TPA: hypothetical protein DHW63_11795 [Hyphomonadaceae bacterium]|nr:hypothetical protein [Hyphomonadaceae bacterium]
MASFVYHVGYDLVRPGQNYPLLWSYLGGIGVRVMLSAWVVETPLYSSQLRDAMMRLLDDNDRVFITEITNCNWAGLNLPSDTIDLLRRRFP